MKDLGYGIRSCTLHQPRQFCIVQPGQESVHAGQATSRSLLPWIRRHRQKLNVFIIGFQQFSRLSPSSFEFSLSLLGSSINGYQRHRLSLHTIRSELDSTPISINQRITFLQPHLGSKSSISKSIQEHFLANVIPYGNTLLRVSLHYPSLDGISIFS